MATEPVICSDFLDPIAEIVIDCFFGVCYIKYLLIKQVKIAKSEQHKYKKNWDKNIGIDRSGIEEWRTQHFEMIDLKPIDNKSLLVQLFLYKKAYNIFSQYVKV